MDGHDKLKPFGICIYGAIDSWSHKVLKLHVVTNNNNPQRAGVQFLQTVEQMGVCPQKVTTDKGSETGDIATFQITFLHLIGRLEHLFTTSQHNQRIESLWGQLMKQKNITICDSIICAIFKELYDPGQPIHKVVFLHLLICLVQHILDSFILEHNFTRIAKSKYTLVPTGVAPEVCHYAPEKYKGTEGGIEVPKEVVQNMIAHYYPDEETLFQITPPIFAAKVSNIIAQLGVIESEISLSNVWSVLTQVVERLESMHVDIDEFPVGVLNPDGEYEEYDRLNRFQVDGTGGGERVIN
ncbi:hypothetical protein CROQUDRAFT_696401 [Cronartium quercuum f. sp. fusiforme G11]|uniref:Integrase core domain-containing protein n=1 Tax=Cronartium quercuum f. sp. fusiforme G11 TaxID=708437 RepID=A0A9P6TCW5_9BASI|nr:hypothetical protein CROQUDRAFT_696401 [Cronartium quercuum f. sp. fusiforme G11]